MTVVLVEIERERDRRDQLVLELPRCFDRLPRHQRIALHPRGEVLLAISKGEARTAADETQCRPDCCGEEAGPA